MIEGNRRKFRKILQQRLNSLGRDHQALREFLDARGLKLRWKLDNVAGAWRDEDGILVERDPKLTLVTHIYGFASWPESRKKMFPGRNISLEAGEICTGIEATKEIAMKAIILGFI